jgi:hypothetical protein
MKGTTMEKYTKASGLATGVHFSGFLVKIVTMWDDNFPVKIVFGL